MAALYFILSAIIIGYVSSLCSSYDYANKIRTILMQQQDYNVYEGKLIFRLNATSEIGTNPNGMYGTAYFENFENITNPNSMAPYQSFYLRPSSALIFAGCTCPSSIYFSWTSYILDRFNDYANGSHLNHKLLWSSLGASLNNLLWNTTTNTNNITNNYDSLTTVIQTGDNITYNDLNNLLTKNGISSHEINLQSLPNKYIEFLPYKYNTNNIHQYNKTYDTGTILIRIAMPQNKEEYQQYINKNQTVYLLDPKLKNVNIDSNQPKQPFEPLRRDPYSNKNINETSVYKEILNQYKNDLINYMQINYNFTYITTITFWNAILKALNTTDYGFGCIEQNKNCGGECRDAVYWQTNSLNPFNDDNEYNIILGVMHSNPDIKQSLYSNIVIQDFGYDDGNSLHVTMLQYNGSALILPIKTNINKNYLKNLFVVQWTSPNLCIDGLPGFCYHDIPKLSSLYIRDYLNGVTKTRPDWKELVPSILVKFKKEL